MDFKDIPKEVLYIQMMEASPYPWLVGMEEYNRVSAVKDKKGDRGIEDLINDSVPEVGSVVTEQDFIDLFEMLNKSENDKYKKKMADEALWNKYYGKYKLKYRG